jgi:hypothetical protein
MHLQGGLAGRRLDGDMTQINWSVWLLWIFGAVVVFVTSYLYLLLPVVVFAVGLASYLLWRMHPIPLFAGQDWALSKRGLDRRRTVASKSVWLLAVGSAVVFLAAATWGGEFVLPLHVKSRSPALDRLAQCVVAPKPTGA